MLRLHHVGLAIVWVCGVGLAQVDANLLTLEDCAVMSRGKVSFDTSVTVDGTVAGRDNVWIGNKDKIGGSVVSGGDLGMGTGVSVKGDADAGKALNINSQSYVEGMATYGTTYWLGNKTKVAGGVKLDPYHVDIEWPTFPELRTSGTGTQWYKQKSEVHLAPGDYGRLEFSNNCVVYLSEGEYNLSSLWMGDKVTFVMDTSKGYVELNIVNDYSAGTGSSIVRKGDGSVLVNSGKQISLGNQFSGDASFYSYAGEISIGTQALITGQLYANTSIWVGTGSHIEGHAPTVPEPVSAGLLALGGIGMILRRRSTSGRTSPRP